jgi:O-acetyl-ADP-ribose deacetylase (regulator of RNase III)
MLPEKVILVDLESTLVRAWREAFQDEEAFEVIQSDYFERDADAMVSPANSFGIMDGGLDLAIRDALGFEVQKRVQAVIIEKHHGELPVGCAEVVETDHARWPMLVCAPTMRIPESVSQTLNAYAAFRAILLAVKRWNERGNRKISSLLCCGLGTGIGNLDERRCAVQMRMAWKQVSGPARIPSFAQIHTIHGAMRTA